MSVASWFEIFCSNLKMDTNTVNDIAYRYKKMTARINLDFRGMNSDTANSLYVGSYGRDTDIHTSDIDVLFILPFEKYQQYNAYVGNGQSALLQEVRNSLMRTYDKTHIKADGQVVGLNFTDGICFEVLPCFINNDCNSYTFPDTNNGGSWKITKPKLEIDEIKVANNNWNKNLKCLCRMARAWKEKWNVPIGGLLIDTLAYNFMSQWASNNRSFLYYDFMSRDFFQYMSQQKKDQNYWLAPGSNQQVHRKGSFENKAYQCYNLTLEAISNEKFYPYTARQKWRDIYGTKFPI